MSLFPEPRMDKIAPLKQDWPALLGPGQAWIEDTRASVNVSWRSAALPKHSAADQPRAPEGQVNSLRCPSPLRPLDLSRTELLPVTVENQQFFTLGGKHSPRRAPCLNPASSLCLLSATTHAILSPLVFISHLDITAGHCHGDKTPELQSQLSL